MRIYFNFRDWWIGYYRGDEHHYVCLLPTLVIRWRHRLHEIKPYPTSQWLDFYNSLVSEHFTKMIEDERNYYKAQGRAPIPYIESVPLQIYSGYEWPKDDPDDLSG